MQSFDQLYLESHEVVTNYLQHNFGSNLSSQEIQDISQRAYLKAWKSMHSFKGDSKFSTWMVSIARNETLMYFRSSKYRMDKSSDSIEDDSLDSKLESFLFEIPGEDLTDEMNRMRSLISNLKPIYREALEYHLKGRSHDWIGKAIGENVNTVKTRVRRAKLELYRNRSYITGMS